MPVSFIRFIYLPDNLPPKLLAALVGIELRQTEILENKDNRSKIMAHDKSKDINSENIRNSV